MSGPADYLECARAIVRLIKKAGFIAVMDDHAGVVKVYSYQTYYVYDMENYEAIHGPDCKLIYNWEYKYFKIEGTTDIISLSEHKATIYGKEYRHAEPHRCGHLLDNKFTRYLEDRWVECDKYPPKFTISGIPDIYSDSPPFVLDDEFNPVEGVEVEIKNKGFKFVINNGLCRNLNVCTIFHFPIIVAESKFKKDYSRVDLFRYVDHKGRPHALLYDPMTTQYTLNSNAQIIMLNSIDKYRVHKRSDGLYNGYLIENDSPNSEIFYFNYVFFKFYNFEVMEIEAKSVNSGLKTKPAIET